MSDFDGSVRRLSEFLVSSSLRAGWGLKVTGLERVPRSGPLIVAFNHASLLDGPMVGATIAPARRPNFLAKKELFSYFPLGAFLRAAGVIPLDRGSADLGAMRSALEILERGGCVAMAPEGTRVKKGETRAPKTGISFLAAKTGAKVTPVRLVGNADFPRVRTVEARFGSPLSAPAEGREAASSFARAVMDAVYAL